MMNHATAAYTPVGAYPCTGISCCWDAALCRIFFGFFNLYARSRLTNSRDTVGVQKEHTKCAVQLKNARGNLKQQWDNDNDGGKWPGR